MYKAKRKLIENGLIPDRDQYFNEVGYEYTLYMSDHKDLETVLKNWLQMQKSRLYDIQCNDSKPRIRFGIPNDGDMVIYRTSIKEVTLENGNKTNAVTYIVYFLNWKIYNKLFLGNEMNAALTGLELGLLSIDPMTWVRAIPIRTHLVNNVSDVPQKWEGSNPNDKLTREEAAKKKLYEGYLADRLCSVGFMVNGGTPMAQAYNIAPNPLVEEKAQENLRLKEEKDNQPPPEEPKKFCQNCGQEAAKGAKFCEYCGAEIQKTEKELLAEEKTLKRYQLLYEVAVGEDLHPFIHVQIDPQKNILMEPQDHGFVEVRLNGITINYKGKNQDKYTQFYHNSGNHDNYMYISDSRVAFINRKYNKDEAATWIGTGGITAFVVGEVMTYTGKAIKAAQRKDKALAGHIRYEWMGLVSYKHKTKMLDDEEIRLIYRDINGSKWLIILTFPKSTDAGVVANDILRRTCNYRLRMRDKKDDDEIAFFNKFASGNASIEVASSPDELSMEILPTNYPATRGSIYRPLD